MQKHTKIYMDHFGYGEQDFVPCEFGCGRCIDVHHLDGRGLGKDVIDNLMGMCRERHDDIHIRESISKEEAQEVHDEFMKSFKY